MAPTKGNLQPLCRPAAPVLDHAFTGEKRGPVSTQIFVTCDSNGPTLGGNQVPIDARTDKQALTFSPLEYYSAKKRSTLIHTTRMSLRNVTSREKSQTQRTPWALIPFLGNSGADKTDLE